MISPRQQKLQSRRSTVTIGKDGLCKVQPIPPEDRSPFRLLYVIAAVIFFNALTAITCALIILGVTLTFQLQEITGITSILVLNFALLIIGCIGVFVGFICLCASCTENENIIYVLLLSLLALVLSSGFFAVFSIQQRSNIQGSFPESFRIAVNESYDGIASPSTVSWAVDSIQIGKECCGIDDNTDWTKAKWYNSDKSIHVEKNGITAPIPWPVSCCVLAPELRQWINDDHRAPPEGDTTAEITLNVLEASEHFGNCYSNVMVENDALKFAASSTTYTKGCSAIMTKEIQTAITMAIAVYFVTCTLYILTLCMTLAAYRMIIKNRRLIYDVTDEDLKDYI